MGASITKVVVEPHKGMFRARAFIGSEVVHEQRFHVKQLATSYGRALAKEEKAKLWVCYQYR